MPPAKIHAPHARPEQPQRQRDLADLPLDPRDRLLRPRLRPRKHIFGEPELVPPLGQCPRQPPDGLAYRIDPGLQVHRFSSRLPTVL